MLYVAAYNLYFHNLCDGVRVRTRLDQIVFFARQLLQISFCLNNHITMPSAALLHAAFFTVGIAVGVSTAAAVGVPSWKKRQVIVQAPGNQPVVQIDTRGSLEVSKDVLKRGTEVLKYGNPGEEILFRESLN